MTSPLAPLLDLPDVAEAGERAREAVDAALRHRALRRQGGPLAAEVGLRSAWASAALEDHEYGLEALRSGTVTDPVAQGALRLSAALDGLAPRWTQAPRQVLARLHVLAASGSTDADLLGRPDLDADGMGRLDTLLALLTSSKRGAPAWLTAAVVHGELLALRPFPGPNGLVARAAARLTMISGGLDPRGLLAPEVGHLERQPEYVGCANSFATGTPDGVRAWLKHCAAATELAAAALTEIGDQLLS
ncbi:oxidoreductase [Luedemannella helvata]|uniref:Fido domain-containing protein n=1 Tax=Luedemannella helvata TaxID=349315 RepID=A0ABN2JRY3_9ACTN